MTFKITGHSGCLIELLEAEGRSFIRKSTQKPDYIKRLITQAEKQKNYRRMILPEGFDVPEVYYVHKEAAMSYFDMAYINASDFISFLIHADITAIDKMCMTIQTWITHCVQSSELAPFSKDGFLLKLGDVKERIFQNPLCKPLALNPILKGLDDVLAEFSPVALLPQGMCHGDLTFSNMLIHDSQRITFIDMLDNFIETPLQDIVKLRQDTSFFWSLLLHQEEFNRLHIESIMKYIDERIDSYCQQYDFYQEYYLLFQILNHLRILPYAKDKKIIDHTVTTLKKLITR